ncbi:DeoR/GlpR family DNA-binding transcription regulator [Silvibacterium dinghuense]|uniref:DeoR/GlpR transcriptional regulator n=1 Tax=Silvibacterium dinghuense TaxID=1560006 RepID=A0A4Q1SBP0_9BACT|nr:DeoR/GlpR family DNA-binding transcription regulator [Silvibacterium dinghuense]RXS94536.1 DeoR/GlpR transcriptional regulator [Silvibacterium dinghuense]GGH15504.1 DeoR family transcriptional regulator [Silvibacterium dinghuense]
MEGSRIEAILQLLKENTTASIGDIAEQFGVSQMTIRRDLQKLAEQGQVIRIPGGARIERWRGMERTFLERLEKMSPAKRSIGKAAAALVQDGESVVLDSGTTTLYVARALRERRNVVVVTFSMAVLEELASAEEIRLELTGGVYRSSSHDLIGHGVAESLKSIYADHVIFGAASVSFSRGVMVHDPDAQREMLQAGKHKILLVDSSKIGKEATYRLCGIEECDLIITDELLPEADLARLSRQTKVQIAR